MFQTFVFLKKSSFLCDIKIISKSLSYGSKGKNLQRYVDERLFGLVGESRGFAGIGISDDLLYDRCNLVLDTSDDYLVVGIFHHVCRLFLARTE
jgi:hypothetical protein